MKYKECKIHLVSESLIQLQYWIERYKNTNFEKVENTDIRECTFLELDITDYRSTLTFFSKMSKNDIYKISNSIKANPINFKLLKC